jgi:hypothetical protein
MSEPIQGKARNRSRGLVGYGEDRTDIDFTQDVSVVACGIARPIQKVRVPNDRQRGRVDTQDLHQLWRPLGFHFDPKRLKGRSFRTVHHARPWLRLWGVRPSGRWRHQRPDELVAEADDLIGPHVAADHAVRQAGMERLIHDAAAVHKISLAACHEVAERHLLGQASPARMQHTHEAGLTGWRGHRLDAPDPLARVSPVLLEDARASA